MASLEMARTRKYLSRGVVGQTGTDLAVMFTMRYVGGGVVTSVVVTAATDIEMITVAGGVTYTDHLHFAGPATYASVGALVAKINSIGRFEAKVMDCLSSTVIGANGVIAGTLAVDALGNYNIMADTTSSIFFAYRLTYDRGFSANTKMKNGHRVSIQELVTSLTLGGGADANALKIYECTPGGNSYPYSGAETLIYQATPTTGSVATINWASGNGKLTSGEGNDLLVMITDGTSFAVTDYLTVTGELE